MQVTSLASKLNKMNIQNSIVDLNGYNKEVVFSINNMNFSADFNVNANVIESYSRDICFDNTNQEMQRRFFTSLNSLLKYANR